MDTQSPLLSSDDMTESENTMQSIHTAASNIRKTRVQLTANLDILQLKAVIARDADISTHGTMLGRFQEALGRVIAGTSRSPPDDVTRPTWNTVSDRYKNLIFDSELETKRSTAAPRITEVQGVQEVLLDDIELALDEIEEQRRAQQNN